MFGAVASMVRAYEANRSWLKGTQGFNKLRKHYEQAVKNEPHSPNQRVHPKS